MADTYATKTLRELMRVVFLRTGRILLITLLAAGVTYFVCIKAEPIYRSTVTLIFKQPSDKSPVFREQPDRPLEIFVKAQQQIVMSDLVLARAKVIAEDEKLREPWIRLRNAYDALRYHRALPSDPYDPKTARELVEVQHQIEEFLTKRGPNTVADRVQDLLDKHQKSLSDFRDDVKLKTPGGEQVAMTESFQIQVDRPAPGNRDKTCLNAMYAADVLSDMYMVRFRELQSRLAGAADEFMKRVVEEHVKVINNAQARLSEFIDKELDSPGDIAILEQLLKSGTEQGFQIIATRARENTLTLKDNLARSKSMRDLLRGMLPAKAMEGDGAAQLTDEEVSQAIAVIPPEVTENNIIVNRLSGRMLQVQAKLTNLQSTFAKEYGSVQETEAELNQTKRQLLQELVANAKALDISIKSYEDRLTDNASEVKTIETRLDKINRRLTEYQRLKNDVEVTQKQHQDIQKEQVDAFVAAEQARVAITIEKMDKASQPNPDRPAQPLTLVYTAIAGGVGLILAIALAFLGDHFDHTFRTIEDAERYTGLPVVGSVTKQGRTILTSA